MPIPSVQTEQPKRAAKSCLAVAVAPLILFSIVPATLWSVAATVGALNAIVSWWPW